MHTLKYRSAATIVAVTLLFAATLASCDFLEGLFGSGEDDEDGGTPTLVKGLEKAGTFSFSTAARDVVGDGSYAYVATYTYSGTYGGVDVISVANPSSPTRSGYYHPNTSGTSLYAANIAKGGDSVYVDGGNVRMFAKVSVSSPGSPSRVYQKEGTNDVATDIIAEGTTLYYISYSNKCVYIFDVSDTYAPTMGTSYVPTGGEPGAACADSGYFYIRTTGQAIKIAKLNTARTSLAEVGSFPIGENGTGGIAKVGNYL